MRTDYSQCLAGEYHATVCEDSPRYRRVFNRLYKRLDNSVDKLDELRAQDTVRMCSLGNPDLWTQRPAPMDRRCWTPLISVRISGRMFAVTGVYHTKLRKREPGARDPFVPGMW